MVCTAKHIRYHPFRPCYLRGLKNNLNYIKDCLSGLKNALKGLKMEPIFNETKPMLLLRLSPIHMAQFSA